MQAYTIDIPLLKELLYLWVISALYLEYLRDILSFYLNLISIRYDIKEGRGSLKATVARKNRSELRRG